MRFVIGAIGIGTAHLVLWPSGWIVLGLVVDATSVATILWGLPHLPQLRAPDAEVTVAASRSETAIEAAAKHAMFTTMATRYNLTLVMSEGALMTMRGRPRNIERFKAEFAYMRAHGMI